MKRLSATEARKDFFGLLDRALTGETVVIERKGAALRLVPEQSKRGRRHSRPPVYRTHIHGPLDRADQWSWDWEPEKGLKLKVLRSPF